MNADEKRATRRKDAKGLVASQTIKKKEKLLIYRESDHKKIENIRLSKLAMPSAKKKYKRKYAMCDFKIVRVRQSMCRNDSIWHQEGLCN